MGRRTGRADLPLHSGRVPFWLANRMAQLGRVVVEALVLHYGRDEVLRRLAHPFWFQSLGCVMGMDWHSSGITTSVMGALKRGLEPVAEELGLFVCGGRGRHSRATPQELTQVGERVGIDGEALSRTSRLVAKVDNAAVQDGFQIYLHCFVVTANGAWVVVQQGMAPDQGLARRYHWLSMLLQAKRAASEASDQFVEAPHAAIAGDHQGEIINLTDVRAKTARRTQVELVKEGPEQVVRALREAQRAETDLTPLLIMPEHHEVRPENVVERRLFGTLAAAAEQAPGTFEELLLQPGIGPRTVASLAMVSEVIHGAPSRFTDPARFSLAHGGKDGHPFPVPLRVYDATLRVYRSAVDAAKLGRGHKLEALRRIDREARRLERFATAPCVEDFMASERRRSPEYGGMTVFGPAARVAVLPVTKKAKKKSVERVRTRQLELPLQCGPSQPSKATTKIDRSDNRRTKQTQRLV